MLPDLSRPAAAVALDLLGCVLAVRGGSDDPGTVAIRLTEVEAYQGRDDPASHAFRGPTRRTGVMFGPPGRLYVYLSYGIHHCVNIVCDMDGTAAAVLVRAGEVVEGAALAQRRRGPRVPVRRLASGPGCVGQALGLSTADSGTVLGGGRAELRPRTQVPPVARGPRVGISRATIVPWRFWIPGDPSVSVQRHAAPETT